MRKHDGPTLLNTLMAVDGHLKRPVRIVIVGGAAAVLQYGSSHATMDVDLYESFDPAFWVAYAAALAADPGLAPIRRGLLRPRPVLLLSPRAWRVIEGAKLKGLVIEGAHVE